MDKKTRVLRALNGQSTDRVPFGFWHHFTDEQLGADNGLSAHLRYYQNSGVDFIKIMSDGYGAPAPYDVRTAADWRNIRPCGKNSPYLRGQIERAKRVNEALQGDCLTFYNIFAPFSLMRQDDREEMVMRHLKEDRKSVLEGLRIIAEDARELAQGVIEAGCEGIYLALQGSEKGRFTPEEYAEIVAPSDLLVLNGARERTDNNIAHLCGWAGDANNLDIWRDYPAKAFNWAIFIEGMNLVEGRTFFGGKTVIGGFDNRRGHLLHTAGTKAEVQAFAKKIVQEYEIATGGREGLIVGADCTIWLDVDDSRFRWVLEALEELA